MNRRGFIAGLTATAVGILVPERKIWALDRTMVRSSDALTEREFLEGIQAAWIPTDSKMITGRYLSDGANFNIILPNGGRFVAKEDLIIDHISYVKFVDE